MTNEEVIKILKNEYLCRININSDCALIGACMACEYAEDKDDVTNAIGLAIEALSKQSASSEQVDKDTNVPTKFKPGDKFILELGAERRMLDEFEIAGTDLYIKTSLLEKLTRYEPETVTNCHDLTGDLISRQKAINAFHYYFRDGFEEDKWWNSTHVLAAIEGLPTEQSKLKWETCFDCPLSHGCPKIKGCTNEQAAEYASQIPNDCPLSAQPETNCSEIPNNSDLISRQAALNALEWKYAGKAAFDAIKALPSVQPEIKPIDYRDCANAMLKMWMDDVLTGGEYNRIMGKLNKFESERRNDG